MSDRYVVRRFIDLSDTEGGESFHQFIGIVEEPDDWIGNEPEDRVRAIIEAAYEASTLDTVRRQDAHKVARIDRECDINAEVLQSEPSSVHEPKEVVEQ